MTLAPDPSAPPKPRQAAPCILDLSRSFSRAARLSGTGIDRVERAYWAEIARRDRPAWAIVRHGRCYALLDQAAADGLMRRLQRHLPGEPHLARIAPRIQGALRRRRAARYLRRRSTYYGSMAGLMVLLAARFGWGFEYLNVGHCNLDDIFLRQLRRAGASPLRVKLHDMIPLDFPDLARNGTPAAFLARTRAAVTYADQIICNSEHTARRVAHHAAAMAARPDCLVAHLGIAVPKAFPARAPQEPYFICVGTIEPRKNHAFLFDVWQRLENRGGPVPRLLIVGSRGWRNDHVFQFLDRSPLMGRVIKECGSLPDREMFALMSGAAGLLMPSLEEGFGLPALEARALGVDVISSPLPVFQELLQDGVTMLPTDDPQVWAEAIRARVQCERSARAAGPARVPTWEEHFAKVFDAEAPGCEDQAAQGALTSVSTV